MRRALLIVLLVVVVVTLAMAFHHPPMRLMPAPQVFRTDGSAVFAALEEAERTNRIRIFYATNRLALGPAENRLYTGAPDRETSFGQATIRVGDDGTGWEEILRLSTGDSDEARPFLHLETMAEAGRLPRDAGAADALPPGVEGWLAAVEADLARRRSRDIIIYVHGANTTVERGVGQAAQLHHFTGRNATVIAFVWPTAENFLRYSRDIHTGLGAAPHLARLVGLLAAHTSADKIDVFTYSAGGTVGSEAMGMLGRLVAQGAPDPRLGDVYHAAPDADFRDFVADLEDYADVARRVSVAINTGDSALRLAQVVNRASRAGRPDIAELSPEAAGFLLQANLDYGLEVVRVRPENIPGLSPSSHTFWYEDPWVSSDVLVSLLYHLPPALRGLAAGEGPGGSTYWTFPPDYPEALAGVLAHLAAEGRLMAPAPAGD